MRKALLTLSLVVLSGWVSSVSAEVLYVSPAGNDNHPGTIDKPVKTFKQVRHSLQKDPKIDTVIFKKGTYTGSLVIDKEKIPNSKLTIKAEKNGTVIFDGALYANDLKPAKIADGVYSCEAKTTSMWEEDTRVRYTAVGALDTVRKVPATFFADKNKIYYHTSDNAATSKHTIGLALNENGGIYLRRDNTTVTGIKFKNYLAGDWSSAIMIRAGKATITNCEVTNSKCGFFTYSTRDNCRDIMIDSCHVEDVKCGIYAMGKNVTVKNSVFIKKRDKYMVPGYWQDDNGIQFYYPGGGGKAEFNLVKGFHFGIYVKCKGKYQISNNTLVDVHSGLYRSRGWRSGVYVRNIISNATTPFHSGIKINGAKVNNNCLWNPKNPTLFWNAITGALRSGWHDNMIADPRFADHQKGDYRLLPESPCLRKAPQSNNKTDEIIGAFPVVPKDYQDTTKPTLKLKLSRPARPVANVGKVVGVLDLWIGGDKTQLPDIIEKGQEGKYLTTARKLNLEIIAYDSFSRADKMRFKVGNEAWGAIEKFSRFKKINIPTDKDEIKLSAKVADLAGNWSEVVTISIKVNATAPKLIGTPVVYHNNHGVVISFKTDKGAFAKVAYGVGGSLNNLKAEADHIIHHWDVMLGQDKITTWRKTRLQHSVTILTPNVATGKTYNYRVLITDKLGNKSKSETFKFTVAGKPSTYTVSAKGVDNDSNNKSFQTVQYAVDRALPGDTITLAPGVYLGETYISHGGVKGAPIIIRGNEKERAVFDGVRKTACLFRIDNSPYITLQNLEIRWFTAAGAGIYAINSPSLTIEGCKIWNRLWNSKWGVGYGIFLHRSPNANIKKNLVYRTDEAFVLLESPSATISDNTCVSNLQGALILFYSCKETKIYNNAFCFNGNQQMFIEAWNKKDFESLYCDYNNFATVLGKSYIRKGVEYDKLKVLPHKVFRSGSKTVIHTSFKRYHIFKDWKKETGKGEHSIFANPLFVDPINYDFNLNPNSPNIGAGKDGADIGALGVLN